jgi:hypothetical protein
VVIYDLGEDGGIFNRIGEIEQNTIKDRYNQLNYSRRDYNFNIMDIFVLTRVESKSYHLVIITKNGIRAYISFDSNYVESLGDNISHINYPHRPVFRYTMILKHFGEPSIGIELNDNPFVGSVVQSKILKMFQFSNQVFYLDNRFMLFYKDEVKNKKYLDVVEYEETNVIKHDQTDIKEFRNKEIFYNILATDISKELYNVQRVYTPNEDLGNLIKNIEYENLIPRDLKFVDSIEHYNVACMSSYCKQFFSFPEEFIISTSSQLISVIKLRPMDILLESLDNEELFDKFINDFGIYETSTMLLDIIVDKAFVFFTKVEGDGIALVPNDYEIISKANEKFFALIDKCVSILFSGKLDIQSKQKNSDILKDTTAANLNAGSKIIFGEAISEASYHRFNRK